MALPYGGHVPARARSGIRAQEALWSYVASGLVKLHDAAGGEWQRMRSLMSKYSDAPMDLADASLVSAAGAIDARRVFTLDQHFRAYRLREADPFEVIP